MKKRISIIVFGIILAIFIGTVKVEAASADITATKATAEVGDNVSITVNFTAAAWNLKVSGEGISSKGYASQTDDLSERNTVDTLKLDTSKVGTYVIYLIGDITDQNGNTIKINKSTTVNINQKTVQPDPKPEENDPVVPTKSNNANLSNLGINPKDYDFNNFKSSRTSYVATVPNDIEEIEVWYKQSDTKSTVSITAEKGLKVSNGKVSGLKVGTNKITITVTAEAGNTKKYTIAVTRKEEGAPVEPPVEDSTDEQPDVPEEPTDNEVTDSTKIGEGIETLTIAGITLKPEFDTNIYEYEAILEEDLRTLEIDAKTTSDKYRVAVAGNEDLKNGENLITLIVYDAENTVIATYQVTVMKNTVNQNEINNIFGELKKEEMIKRIAIISALVVIIILIVIYIIMKAKMKKAKNKTNKEETKNIDEEIDNNLENEFKMHNEIEEEPSLGNEIKSDTEKSIETESVIKTENNLESDINFEDIMMKIRNIENITKTGKLSNSEDIQKIENIENTKTIEEKIEDIMQTDKKKGKHF